MPSLLRPSALLPRAAFASLFTCAALTLAAPAAHAQAQVTFSGGSGTPLTITLAAPVTYTVTDYSLTGIDFNFVGVGNLFNNSFTSGTSTLSYTINGNTPHSISGANSGQAGGDVNANDVLLLPTFFPRAFAGYTIVLSAGSFTTFSNVTAAAPQSGSYSTFLVDGSGTRISTNGVSAATAVPEPGELAIMGMLGTSVCGLMIRARRKVSTSTKVAATA